MKTKFYFLALLMSMSSVLPVYSMGDDPLVIVLTKEEMHGNDGPRTGVPISASIINGIITTESNTYSGNIVVTIKDEDGDAVLTAVENVSVNSQFTTNVSSLDDGYYTIYYTLGDTVYYGEFEKQ